MLARAKHSLDRSKSDMVKEACISNHTLSSYMERLASAYRLPRHFCIQLDASAAQIAHIRLAQPDAERYTLALSLRRVVQ